MKLRQAEMRIEWQHYTPFHVPMTNVDLKPTRHKSATIDRMLECAVCHSQLEGFYAV